MDKFISTGFCLTQFLTSSTNGIIYEELTILISLQVTNTLQAVWRCVVCVDTCDIPLLQQIATCWATEAKSHTLNCSIPNYTVNPGLSYTYVYLELHICSDPIIYALFADSSILFHMPFIPTLSFFWFGWLFFHYFRVTVISITIDLIRHDHHPEQEDAAYKLERPCCCPALTCIMN